MKKFIIGIFYMFIGFLIYPFVKKAFNDWLKEISRVNSLGSDKTGGSPKDGVLGK